MDPKLKMRDVKQKQKKQNIIMRKSTHGFSLIEMLVATALFVSVMLIGVGALLALIDANRKAHAINSVMNNLNLAIESMSRKMRVGTTYHCEISNSSPPANISVPKDCTQGGNLIAFEASGGNPSDPNDQIVYRLNGTYIERSEDGGNTFINITAPEVTIENIAKNFRLFYVDGTSFPPSDKKQPKVIMIISGSAGVSDKVRTEFNLQTMVSQRVLDL